MSNIGIVCEGPTDYILIKRIIDKLTGTNNWYFQLQPEPDLTGRYGNGWKGVWKWCRDNGIIKNKIMKDIQPKLDVLVIHLDGDVSRKEKVSHCFCNATKCEDKGKRDPLECDAIEEIRNICPASIPCSEHELSVVGCMKHLEDLLGILLTDKKDTCVVIPCDSMEAWIVAAYDELDGAEKIEDPWLSIIAKKKDYHGIRIAGDKKRQRIFEQFANVVCEKWDKVTELCHSAKMFEENILEIIVQKGN